MIIFSFSGNSQNADWELGLSGSPIIFNADELSGLFDYFTLRPDVSVSFGVEAKRSVGERSKVGMGVNPTSLRYSIDYNFFALDPSAPADPVVPEKSIVNIRYIEIPLFYDYRLLKKGKYSMSLSLGVTSSFFSKSQENTIYEDKTKRPSSYSSSNTFTKTNVSGDIGVGLSADMGQRISVSFEPTINYFFKGFTEKASDNPIVFRGIFGVAYKIFGDDSKIEVKVQFSPFE